MSSNQNAFKSGVWYTISNFLIKGIDFLTIPVFARLMTQSEYGSYSNFVSWIQIVLIIGTLYLFPSLYSARYDYEKKINTYICSILIVGSGVAVFELLIVSCFRNNFEGLSSVKYIYILIMFLYAMVRPAFEILLVQERIKYNYKKSVIISTIASVSSILTAVILVVVCKDKLAGRIFGTYIPLIIICLIIYINYIRKGFSFDYNCVKYALKICVPYIPHALAMTVLSSTDRIMITHYCGSNDTALYSLAYTCALAVTVLWSSVNTAFAPWLGEKIHEKKTDEIFHFSSKYVLIVAIPVLAMIIMAPEMLLILGGKSYVDAKFVIPPVMAGCFVQFIYSMYVDVEQFLKKTGGMAIASVVGAVLNIILNYIFIPKFGYVAAAFTTLVGYIFLFLSHYYLVKRIHMTHIYDQRKIVLVLIGVILFSLISIKIYDFSIVRYIIAIVYLCLAFIFVKKMNVKRLFNREEKVETK